jgi:hypothetical protein
MTHGRELTIRIWESSCGREGIWCRDCRRSTPVEQLLVEPAARAVLRCETCSRLLRTGPSGLTTLQMPRQTSRALAAAEA